MFEVKKLQLHTGIEGFDSPASFGVYKLTGGKPLGVVGKDFTPTQPNFLNDEFVKSLEAKNYDASKVKFQEINGGRKIMISCPITEFSFVNGANLNDVTSFEVVLSTGYDGKTPTSMFINTMRLVCMNGMKAKTTEFQVKFKNVKGNVGKTLMLVNDLDRAISSIDELKTTIKQLSKRDITPTEHRQFIKDVTGLDMDKYNDMNKGRQEIMDAINNSVAIETNRAGWTAWGMLNGITHFTNHVAKPRNGNTTDFLYANAGLFLNNKAQHFALELLN